MNQDIMSAPAITYNEFLDEIKNENPNLINLCIHLLNSSFEEDAVNFAGVMQFVFNYSSIKEQYKLNKKFN